MVFEHPSWLFALAGLPVLLALEVWASRRDGQRLQSLVVRSLWPRTILVANQEGYYAAKDIGRF